MKRALIFGATGLTGNELLQLLLADSYYTEIICFVRRPIDIKHSKLRLIITDFSDLKGFENEFAGSDIYCCLGTTIKKVNYDKEAFKRADLYVPLMIANASAENNADQFLIISALGANPDSKIFYNRVKGELQQQLKEINISAIHIFQPSLLVGNRKEPRLGEKMGEAVLKAFKIFLNRRLKKYRAIRSADVAKAMFNTAVKGERGYFIYTSDQIQKIADG